MKRSLAITLLLAIPLLVVRAQEPAAPCYSEGNADTFLAEARANKRPAIVLYNFNKESG